MALSRPSIKKVVTHVLSIENEQCDEVSIYFVDVKTISEMHAKYFDDPTPTDCISFPLDQDFSLGYRILGEIFISPQAGIDFALKRKADPYKEVTLYLVHGLLHLMGYDDIEKKDRLKMRKAEKRHMDALFSKEIYLHAPTG